MSTKINRRVLAERVLDGQFSERSRFVSAREKLSKRGTPRRRGSHKLSELQRFDLYQLYLEDLDADGSSK